MDLCLFQRLPFEKFTDYHFEWFKVHLSIVFRKEMVICEKKNI